MENFKAMENMKRLETLCIAGAVAVLAVSCGKEEAVREDGASKVGFTAAELQVKTVFGEKADGEYPVLWTSNEKVALFYNSQTGGQTGGGQYADVLPSADGHTAGFSASFTDDGNDVFGEGDYLKFTVYTDTDTWVKTVNFSADRTLAFKTGRISSFSVSAHGFEKQ